MAAHLAVVCAISTGWNYCIFEGNSQMRFMASRYFKRSWYTFLGRSDFESRKSSHGGTCSRILVLSSISSLRKSMPREPAIYDDNSTTRGGHSKDDHLATTINRGSGSVDGAYAEEFFIVSTRCQHVFPYSYSFRVYFDIVRQDAPAPDSKEYDNEETKDENLGL
ncbi:hypothetical protein PanWU01x14_110880 [Parasponia andersonii]|uniref:Uncharacterized protein n=1 Tax=Parasponia andersonii TaxID=3476 RepID=A0A2P5CYU9_PARAD|nr:hypothetical protein PanWU01x14_110880 [Parasponia andersonii]